MANLKEIRIRIASVSSTMKVTSAMKMVSAAKLKKAQNTITSMRPYANKLTELLQNLSATLEGDDQESVLTEQREVEKVLIVAISSNRGLAGAFNSNIVKACKTLVSETYKAKQVDYYTLGKKASDILKKEHSILETNTDIFEDLTFEKNDLGHAVALRSQFWIEHVAFRMRKSAEQIKGRVGRACGVRVVDQVTDQRTLQQLGPVVYGPHFTGRIPLKKLDREPGLVGNL